MRTWIGCSLGLALALGPRLSAAEAEEAGGAQGESAPAGAEEKGATGEEPAAGEATESGDAAVDGAARETGGTQAAERQDSADAETDPDSDPHSDKHTGRAGESDAAAPRGMATDAPPEAPPSQPSSQGGGFSFGSYGRIGIGTDLRGSTPQQANIVEHGSRIAEPNYVEADLYYDVEASPGVDVRTVTTLALADRMFHYTGDFDAAPALRNLYAEAIIDGDAGVWIGSRMVRGDDIYLLDFWPLDELNILGGGLFYNVGPVKAEVNVGANRLLDPFQYQEREISDPVFGSQTVAQLDRQRFIANTKLSYRLVDPSAGHAVDGSPGSPPAGLGLDASFYLEGHAISSGTRLRPDDTPEALPRDYGFTAGGQLSSWGFGPGATHANLFARVSLGLGAYDELEVPTHLSPDLRTYPGARELLLGLSGNYELPRAPILVGGYLREMSSASPGTGSHEEGWEYIVTARPHYEVLPHVLTAVDLSYQVRFPRGLNPSELIAQDPAVAQVAPMLIYAPSGAGGYDRPHFRLVYRAAYWNEGARNLFAPDDPRRDRATSHFLGLQAEWWFNSTYQ